MSGHQPIEPQHVDLMQRIGRVIGEAFKPYGFCLLVFPFDGDKGRMNYISNAQRKEMLIAMKEFIARNESRVSETETRQ